MKELNHSCTHTSKSKNLYATCNISRFTISLTFTIQNYYLLIVKSLNRFNRAAVVWPSKRTPLSFLEVKVNTYKTFPHGRTWTNWTREIFLQNFETNWKIPIRMYTLATEDKPSVFCLKQVYVQRLEVSCSKKENCLKFGWWWKLNQENEEKSQKQSKDMYSVNECVLKMKKQLQNETVNIVKRKYLIRQVWGEFCWNQCT